MQYVMKHQALCHLTGCVISPIYRSNIFIMVFVLYLLICDDFKSFIIIDYMEQTFNAASHIRPFSTV